MRVAIIHDWLTNMGGSERVISVFHEMFPEAPIYTSVFERENIAFPLRNADIRTSFLQKLPKPLRKHQRLLPLMPYAFEQFDLSSYDLVISSSHACAKGVIVRADTFHVCYCYTPMRYAWDMYHDYINPLKGLKRWFAIWQLHKIRVWDQLNSQRVDQFIAISQSVANRIKKHYGADSVVIAPPVDIDRFRCTEEREDYYLVVSRLVAYKRVDIAIEACLYLGKKLVIIGIGEEEKYLKSICAGKENQISFLGWQSEERVADYLAKAKAFLFPGEEDFGLTMVEALASGCPVIAYGSGGALDIITDGETGVLFEEQTVEGMISAIIRFEQLSAQGVSFSPEILRKHAEKFSVEIFKEKFLNLINQMISER